MNGRILVTGGTGYIGSHVVVQLIQAGWEPVVLDNLCNSSADTLRAIARITGAAPRFIEGDVRDADLLSNVFGRERIDTVMHFAGLKAVAEAQVDPIAYYDNNVQGSITLVKQMAAANVRRIVFSSSATVYGNPGYPCYQETTPCAPTNVYGHSKRVVEQLLISAHDACTDMKTALLRYFNPIGAHASGWIGENLKGVPNNLMPLITQAAAGLRPRLRVFGSDYPTPDGTARRDYIHVDDLAAGHLAALRALDRASAPIIVNLGTGTPYSVLEVIRAFETATGVAVPHEMAGRRPGDLPEYYADAALAKDLLGWQADLGLERMCQDAWRWQQTCLRQAAGSSTSPDPAA